MRSKLSEDELDRLLSSRAVVEDVFVRLALEGVRRDIESNVGERLFSRPVSPSVRRGGWVRVGLAGAAVGVASLVGVANLTGGAGGSGLPLAVSPAAAAQLSRVARAATAQPVLQASQWKYVETETTMKSGPGAGLTSTVTEQDWYAAGGSARERVQLDGRVTSDKLFLDPGSTSAPAPGVDESSAPSSPQALLSEIAAAASPSLKASPTSVPAYFWAELRNVLLTSRSPQLSAMAFDALKYLPGTTVVGPQTDQLGRSGIAISFTDPNDTTGIDASHTIIVSTNTGEILESYDTLLASEAGISAGTVIYRALYTQQGIVDSDTALPDGGSQPLSGSVSTSTTPEATTPAASTTSDTAGAAR